MRERGERERRRERERKKREEGNKEGEREKERERERKRVRQKSFKSRDKTLRINKETVGKASDKNFVPSFVFVHGILPKGKGSVPLTSSSR